jgi:hypothetical protein
MELVAIVAATNALGAPMRNRQQSVKQGLERLCRLTHEVFISNT